MKIQFNNINFSSKYSVKPNEFGKISKNISEKRLNNKQELVDDILTRPDIVAQINDMEYIIKTLSAIYEEKQTQIKNLFTKKRFSNGIKAKIASKKDLEQVYEIDKEAFKKNYEVENNFEDYLESINEDDITTRIFKKRRKVLGYYQLEPINDGHLYISGMAIAKDYRGSKLSGYILKNICQDLLEFVKNNGIKEVKIHVNANDKSLVKLYHKLGFKIKSEHQGPDYRDYSMFIDVENYHEPSKEEYLFEMEKLKFREELKHKHRKFYDMEISEILKEVTPENIEYARKLTDDTTIRRYEIPGILKKNY